VDHWVSQLSGQTNHEAENINQKPSAPKYSSTMCRSSFAANKMQHTATVHSALGFGAKCGQVSGSDWSTVQEHAERDRQTSEIRMKWRTAAIPRMLWKQEFIAAFTKDRSL
jgi:hypothetical protein